MSCDKTRCHITTVYICNGCHLKNMHVTVHCGLLINSMKAHIWNQVKTDLVLLYTTVHDYRYVCSDLLSSPVSAQMKISNKIHVHTSPYVIMLSLVNINHTDYLLSDYYIWQSHLLQQTNHQSNSYLSNTGQWTYTHLLTELTKSFCSFLLTVLRRELILCCDIPMPILILYNKTNTQVTYSQTNVMPTFVHQIETSATTTTTSVLWHLSE